MEVPDLGHSASRGGGEVGNTEAARSGHVSAGSRGSSRNRGAQRPHPRARRCAGVECSLYGWSAAGFAGSDAFNGTQVGAARWGFRFRSRGEPAK